MSEAGMIYGLMYSKGASVSRLCFEALFRGSVLRTGVVLVEDCCFWYNLRADGGWLPAEIT